MKTVSLWWFLLGCNEASCDSLLSMLHVSHDRVLVEGITLNSKIMFLERAKLTSLTPSSSYERSSIGGTSSVAPAIVSLTSGGPSDSFPAIASIKVGICMQCVRLKSIMWTVEYPSMASSMAALAAVNPNRCHGVKSTKLASSMMENLCV
ncbi:hypothetical protein HanRHA438_Chr12g0563621 [Helianthus annuus]|nr:hypothetical protein HanRHA438_Chr12g0563621 [Helianthus annuus]